MHVIRKLLFVSLLSSLWEVESFAVCAYQDCAQNVLAHKIHLSSKISSTLETTYASIDQVDRSYNEHTQALIEQNSVLSKFEKLTATNNLTLKQIAMEQKKLSDLIAQQNKMQAKKAEALQFQAEQLNVISKIQLEAQ